MMIQEQYRKVIEIFDRAIEIDPSNVFFYFQKSTCYLKLKEYNNAMQYIDKCL
jgi:tetratricopeptide (TPR) repeat protein